MSSQLIKPEGAIGTHTHLYELPFLHVYFITFYLSPNPAHLLLALPSPSRDYSQTTQEIQAFDTPAHLGHDGKLILLSLPVACSLLLYPPCFES